MRNFLYVLFGLIALTACNSSSSEQADVDSATKDSSAVSNTQQSCFQYIKDKDTAKMTLMSSGVITTGELSYHLDGKDKNNGIFEGELHGDTLIAEYTFNSEGKESVRQVAFLKKGNQLIEGFGEQEDKNGKMIFKNTAKLTFGNSIVFSKSDCY